MDETSKKTSQPLSDEKMAQVTAGTSGYISYDFGDTGVHVDDLPSVCPKCGGNSLLTGGTGTDRLKRRFVSYQCSNCGVVFQFFYTL